MRIAVASSTYLQSSAEALAAELALPLDNPDAPESNFLLLLTPERLELRELGPKAAGPIFVDFLAGRADYRRRFGGGKGQTLAKAVGIKGHIRPTVLDATAGLGRDAFVLANLGCTVHLLERSKIVAALLADGLKRARQDATVGPIVKRMQLHSGDAIKLLQSWPEQQRPDVVYLDPMYPHSTKSALQKKEMRIFRLLVGADQDASELLTAALNCAKKRVVVKRPRGAPTIAGREPNMAISSKNTRYDLYLL